MSDVPTLHGQQRRPGCADDGGCKRTQREEHAGREREIDRRLLRHPEAEQYDRRRADVDDRASGGDRKNRRRRREADHDQGERWREARAERAQEQCTPERSEDPAAEEEAGCDERRARDADVIADASQRTSNRVGAIHERQVDEPRPECECRDAAEAEQQHDDEWRAEDRIARGECAQRQRQHRDRVDHSE
jgi:hypothetical protein